MYISHKQALSPEAGDQDQAVTSVPAPLSKQFMHQTPFHVVHEAEQIQAAQALRVLARGSDQAQFPDTGLRAWCEAC